MTSPIAVEAALGRGKSGAVPSSEAIDMLQALWACPASDPSSIDSSFEGPHGGIDEMFEVSSAACTV